MDPFCASLLLPRESGDGEDSGAPSGAIVLGKPATVGQDQSPVVLESTKKEVIKSKKLERITKNIQDTWLRRKLNHPSKGGRFIDVADFQSVILPAQLPPRGKRLVQLVPRQIRESSKPARANKEPRFVPFEPYKAAVSSMVPRKETKQARRNNVDLNVLVEQMTSVKTAELQSPLASTIKDAFDSQKGLYEAQVKQLQLEKDSLQKELQFQAEVNRELKNLLVSSVGDDTFVSDKITSMSEDKLHLAESILKNTKELTQRTEMIDHYAGQIEVWRSKFLASSVMIEELARWKTSLTQRNTALLRANKKLMENMARMREIQVELLTNLSFLDTSPAKGQFEELPTSNALDLAKENLSISQRLVLQHNKLGMPEVLDLTGLDALTDAEKLGARAMESSKEELISTDELLKAVIGQTYCRKEKEVAPKEEQ